MKYDDRDVIYSELIADAQWNLALTHRDSAPARGLMVGLRVSWNPTAQKVTGLRPIYQVGHQCVYGSMLGKSAEKSFVVCAIPNYALGGLIVSYASGLKSIQAVFVRIGGPLKLQTKDRYFSEVVGTETGLLRRIYGEGRPIVEAFAPIGPDGLAGIGLGAVQPAEPADAPVVTAPASKPDAAAPPSTPTPKPAMRTWRSAQGNFSVTARYQSIEGTEVLLINEAGKTIRVALDKLSEEDRQYVQQLKTGSR
jgi:hypothetical protein